MANGRNIVPCIYPCNGPCHGPYLFLAFVSPLPLVPAVLPVEKKRRLTPLRLTFRIVNREHQPEYVED
jgi:hypothetical protein